MLSSQEWDILRDRVDLSPQQLRCVREYYWKDKTQSRIGKELQITQPVVWEYLRRAKRKIIDEFNLSTSLLDPRTIR